jgi:hypothetical protein
MANPVIDDVELLGSQHASDIEIERIVKYSAEELGEEEADEKWTTIMHKNPKISKASTSPKRMTMTSFDNTRKTAAYKKLKKECIEYKKAEIMKKVDADKYLWERKKPTKMAQNYVDDVEKSLGKFFYHGYVKNFNDGKPASYMEVAEFVKKTIKKYDLLVSGGYLLKNMGFSEEGKSKPSVDCDIYIPYSTPDKYPEFYDEMALLFNCDMKKTKDGNKYSIKHTITNKLPGNRSFFFRKNGIFSVFKHSRNDHNKGNESINNEKDIHAEMDLVRAASHMTPEKIIRGFDLSVCMNWYDGDNIFCMDESAIRKKTIGHLNYSYVPLVLGIHDDSGRINAPNMTSRSRLLKYILRGYSFKYIDPRTGEEHVLTTRDLANAVKVLPNSKREKFYVSHPNERPANMPMMNALIAEHKNMSHVGVNSRGFMSLRRSVSPRRTIVNRAPNRSKSRSRSHSHSHTHTLSNKSTKQRRGRSRKRSPSPARFKGTLRGPGRYSPLKKATFNNNNERENK